jgi:hypothetical protein
MTGSRDKRPRAGVRDGGGGRNVGGWGDGEGVDGSGDGRFGGVITTAELADAGASDSQIRRLVRRGALLRLGYGTYARAGLVDAEPPGRAREHAMRVAAALAVSGPGAVASHHSAALLHGLDMLGRVPGDHVAVTRPPGGTSTRTGREGIRLHIATLPAEHLSVRRGMPVTSLARTVADLARASPFTQGVVVADSALRSNQASKADLDLCITACAGWPGIRNARRVAAFADARSESVLESISRVAFHDRGLPPPDLQAWVGHEDEVIARADFLWRAYRTVGEADGAVKYADPARAIAQLDRDARLRAAGFEVVHFTWQQVTRTPDLVVASIKTAFRRGSTR